MLWSAAQEKLVLCLKAPAEPDFPVKNAGAMVWTRTGSTVQRALVMILRWNACLEFLRVSVDEGRKLEESAENNTMHASHPIECFCKD
jgi:hypothetical protein